MTLDSEMWSRFSADPRTDGSLRASDTDRHTVFEALGIAFAEGLITRDEHEERLDEAARITVLQDIVPLLDDLIRPSDQSAPGTELMQRSDISALEEFDAVPTTPEAIEATAVELYRAELRRRILGAAVPSAITTAIWLITVLASSQVIFFWPAFVILGTGVGVLTALTQRSSIIRDRRRMLTVRAKAKLGDEHAQARIRANPRAYEFDVSGTRAQRRIRRAELERRRQQD